MTNSATTKETPRVLQVLSLFGEMTVPGVTDVCNKLQRSNKATFHALDVWRKEGSQARDASGPR